MGFSLTGTHVVFFIAAVIIAGGVSGVFLAVVNDVTSSFEQRGKRVQEQLDIEFTIINDPDNIPSSGGDYIFYLKNIGTKEIPTSTSTFNVFIDGEIVVTPNYSFTETSIQSDDVTTLNIDQGQISSGDHTLRIVGPQAIDDEFTFTI